MSTEYILSVTAYQHELLRSYLYPGDGREAVAILLCGRRAGDHRHRLLVREVYPVLNHWYRERSNDRVTWSTDALEPLLEIADENNLSVIKAHSHPEGSAQFSAIDDAGDQQVLPMVRDWVENDLPHGSAVMLPDGQLFGRVLVGKTEFAPIDLITVVGDELHLWFGAAPGAADGDFDASHAQAFGRGTADLLRRLTVGVVGCSGTGSPIIEQLVRLGVKRIILVDDDIVETRNINRILLSKRRHAIQGTSKVAALAEEIHDIGLQTDVIPVHANLASAEAIDTLAEADILFGCMDTIEGRYLLNRLATYYTLPYFDVGVRLVADDDAGIDEICGTIHYLQPGRSSLISRGLFTLRDVAADALKRRDPVAHRQQVKDGYIRGAVEQRPAVISVNTFAASLAVNEFLARLHPYRDEPNKRFAAIGFSLVSTEFYADSEDKTCTLLNGHVGRGETEPRLGLLEFARAKKK